MLLAEFSLTPLDKGASVSRWVSTSLDIIDRSELPYRLGAMGTCVEGEWDDVMALLKTCFERMADECDRVSITFKGDWRRGASGRLTAKIAKVESTLGRKLKT
jgi:uncharacterized protein (TIGR00106 family)